MSLTISSDAFSDNGAIPRTYTADGDDIAPPLAIAGVPEGTKSLALVVEDPDAPDPRAPRAEPFVHWVVYDLPPNTKELSRAPASLPRGAAQGVNGFGKQGYDGPKPPVGRHRYFFKLYALDTVIRGSGLTRDDLISRIEGHVLDEAELIGTYKRAA
jgi:Raf kinase inhibitor-like YbhB/YbcL family protein